MSDFDYIIVGADQASRLLAHRLSDHPGTRVLLLEAGDNATFARRALRKSLHWLRAACAGANLHLRADARAIRVLYEDGRAASVEYQHGGQLHRSRGAAGVILCAAAAGPLAALADGASGHITGPVVF